MSRRGRGCHAVWLALITPTSRRAARRPGDSAPRAAPAAANARNERHRRRHATGWHLTRPPITDVTFPAERLLLTSDPTRGGGNCAPDRAVRDLPPGGALIYLFEYRPSGAGRGGARSG